MPGAKEGGVGDLVVCTLGRQKDRPKMLPGGQGGQIREDTKDKGRQSLHSGVGNMGRLLGCDNVAMDSIRVLGIPGEWNRTRPPWWV